MCIHKQHFREQNGILKYEMEDLKRQFQQGQQKLSDLYAEMNNTEQQLQKVAQDLCRISVEEQRVEGEELLLLKQQWQNLQLRQESLTKHLENTSADVHLTSRSHDIVINKLLLTLREMRRIWEEEQNVLEIRMVQTGTQRKKVKGDGACAFRATSDQRYRTQKRHDEMRALAVTQLRRWQEYYMRKFSLSEWEFLRFVEDLSRPHTWANRLAITALSDALDVTFKALISDPEVYVEYFHPSFGRSSEEYWICSSHCHWDSLYKNEESIPLSPDRVN